MTPEQITELLAAAGAFVLGVIVGFVVRGVVLRHAPQAVLDEDAGAAVSAPIKGRRAEVGGKWRRRDTAELVGRVLLGVVLLGLLAYQQITVSQSSQRLQNLAACQAAQAQDFRDALAARAATSRAVSAASDANAAAQLSFLASVEPGRAGVDQAGAFVEYTRALTAYRDALAAQITTQDANPLVARDCGDL